VMSPPDRGRLAVALQFGIHLGVGHGFGEHDFKLRVKSEELATAFLHLPEEHR
jgi:hypothetical protein